MPRVACPKCQAKLNFNEAAAGKKLRCSKCQGVFRVALSKPVAATSAASPRPSAKLQASGMPVSAAKPKVKSSLDATADASVQTLDSTLKAFARPVTRQTPLPPLKHPSAVKPKPRPERPQAEDEPSSGIMRKWLVGVLALSCCIGAGCWWFQAGPPAYGYQTVSGLVAFQGERIADGSIQFYSTGEQPVLCGGAMIRQGEYRVPQEHGLKPGSYLVKISAPEKLPNPDKDRAVMNPYLSRERIPSKFNVESTLRVEVQAGTGAACNFDLQ